MRAVRVVTDANFASRTYSRRGSLQPRLVTASLQPRYSLVTALNRLVTAAALNQNVEWPWVTLPAAVSHAAVGARIVLPWRQRAIRNKK